MDCPQPPEQLPGQHLQEVQIWLEIVGKQV